MDEVESSVAPSQIADSVMASTIGPGKSTYSVAKSTRSVAKVKFMELIDQAKGLLGDLQEHEEVRETRAAEFYNPRGSGNAKAEVLNLDGRPQRLATVAESNEGRIIAEGKEA